MRHTIAIVGLLFLASCASTTNTVSFPAHNGMVFVKGTYQTGSNITEPRPRQSEFLQTDNGGFVVLDKGAGYYLRVRVLKPPPSPYYIRVEYENPLDSNHPLVNDMQFDPKEDRFQFSSPDVVWGIRNYQDYTIRVMVFTSRDSTEPIDTLIQPVRVYVDTTSGEVRMFKGMQAEH